MTEGLPRRSFEMGKIGLGKHTPLRVDNADVLFVLLKKLRGFCQSCRYVDRAKEFPQPESSSPTMKDGAIIPALPAEL
jgi:hypothetical protein